jgi:hypothetical protein
MGRLISVLEACPPYWVMPATQSWLNSPFSAKGIHVEGTIE